MAFSVVREENKGVGLDVVAGIIEGVLGGPFSGRIGLAKPSALYSAPGG